MLISCSSSYILGNGSKRAYVYKDKTLYKLLKRIWLKHLHILFLLYIMLNVGL